MVSCLVFVLIMEILFVSFNFHGTESISSCGYNSCHPVEEGAINVHIVPHSHDDVGWLKTVDEYYYGLNESIQEAAVQYIIGSVVDALGSNFKRRFIQVETSFFWKWYTRQSYQVKEIVQNHVENGRLEFVGGGWSMNDEATTHYQAIIDQFTWGLRKLNDTFGECGHPKVGWQIDPFGHSREMAAIFAQMGYDAFIFARTDFKERELRESNKTNQMIWKSNPTLGSNYDIFTSILYKDAYFSPHSFCFDSLCPNSPIVDDVSSPFYNVDDKINLFLSEVAKREAVSSTNHIIIPFGGDFTMQNAHMTYENIDKLIHHTNLKQTSGSKYNLLYSTPSCYIKAIHDETRENKRFPEKTDDFLPYGTGKKAYWTGFYTSRPAIKRNERIGNNFLQISKQLQAMIMGKNDPKIDELRSIMGVLQHHDAITGTEQQHVANDYNRLLFNALKQNEDVTSNILNKLTSRNKSSSQAFTSCLLTNISQCPLTENNKAFVVTIYNPLSRNVNKYVRVSVTRRNYTVLDYKGNKVPIQILPISSQVQSIPGRTSNATHDLIFLAEDIGPLGFKSYYVEGTSGDIVTKPYDSNAIHFENINVSIDVRTGLVSSINFNGLALQIDQHFEEYHGVNYVAASDEDRNSGAYVFNPRKASRKVTDKNVNFTVYGGNLIAEIHQTFTQYVSQVIRIYAEESFVEFDWLVGPIPITNVGKEIISVFETNLPTNSTFYTETNGKQLMKRIKNYRPSYNFTITNSVAANYYPITSKIVLRGGGVEFAVINDRSQGGTSLKDGKVELMVHRACTGDDVLGVSEVLQEEAFGTGVVVRGSHYVLAGHNAASGSVAAEEKDITQRKILDAWTFLSLPESANFEQYADNYLMKFSGLTRALPKNVQILTLEPWKEPDQMLLRLEHVFDKDEDAELGAPVSVDLEGIFQTFIIIQIKETSLGANKWLNECEKLHFKSNYDNEENLFSNNGSKRHEENLEDFVVSLNPTEIRTFIVTVLKSLSC